MATQATPPVAPGCRRGLPHAVRFQHILPSSLDCPTASGPPPCQAPPAGGPQREMLRSHQAGAGYERHLDGALHVGHLHRRAGGARTSLPSLPSLLSIHTLCTSLCNEPKLSLPRDPLPAAQLRIYKHYAFDLRQLRPAASRLSFSSYPGRGTERQLPEGIGEALRLTSAGTCLPPLLCLPQ